MFLNCISKVDLIFLANLIFKVYNYEYLTNIHIKKHLLSRFSSTKNIYIHVHGFENEIAALYG